MSLSFPGPIKCAIVTMALHSICVVAQSPLSVSWSSLIDSQAQVYEDPYKELTQPQMKALMELAKVQHHLASGELSAPDEEDYRRRATAIDADLRSEGLDADWILAQREVVAARRQNAAMATNKQLDGRQVELSGYFLHAGTRDNGESLAYLVPDRGLCMHLPSPPPNQVIQLVVEKLPEPMGPCVAAAVRGQLAVEEAQHTLSSVDGPTLVWSRWKMRIHEITTSGSFSAQSAREER